MAAHLEDVENSDLLGYHDESNLLREHDPKACPRPSADGPEVVFPHRRAVEEATVNQDEPHVDHVVGLQAVLLHHYPVAAAKEVSGDSEGGADSGREAEHPAALFRDSIVEFAEGGSRLDPRARLIGVDDDSPEILEVEDDEGVPHEGGIGEAFVVVAAVA
ncbi:Unknown protein [Striga hermonthica]|uniref:Uncharacterized protein n=1 Tax=Striga hermonthica TaxID=68872 RepID=A0A9N7RFB6_STRHE|nr:Unknown protein [Striga hermonthica]